MMQEEMAMASESPRCCARRKVRALFSRSHQRTCRNKLAHSHNCLKLDHRCDCRSGHHWRRSRVEWQVTDRIGNDWLSNGRSRRRSVHLKAGPKPNHQTQWASHR